MSTHARVGGLSLEQRVWRALKRSPDGLRPREVAAALGIDLMAARQALHRLHGKGCVSRTGRTLAIVYRAEGTRPDDMRGTALGSARALLVNDRPRAHAPRRVPRPRLALEAAWGGVITTQRVTA